MRAALLFGITTGMFILLVVNIRALSRGKLVITGVTEFVYAVMNFWIIQHIASARSWHETLAYAAGATTGSLSAILLTRRWDAT